ncbi:hypothetical protein [Halovenus marina]|uniref:hypothetical protein n=1 Tax=Halovenus marina TaxID=3396621 RepID=UPI003F563310
MSAETTSDAADATSRAERGFRDRIRTVLFGDGIGVMLFLGAIAFYTLYWRVGFFIADSVTVANALANVAEGRLAVTESRYGLAPGIQPGMVEVDGTLYGRNYGHVFLAVPVLAVIELVDVLTDLRLALAGVWSLVVLALFRRCGRYADRNWLGTVGAVLATGLFLGAVAVGTAIPDDQHPVLALQLSTMLVGALAATTLYRLLARFHGRRVGAVAGLAFVVATPVSFWATIPKRHVLTVGLVVLTLYWFAVSRDSSHLGARAGAYGAFGLFALLHPFEAVFLLAVFAPLDFLTAPTNDRYSTAVIGGVFFLSVLPLFVVNTLISGNPLKVPRLLSAIPDDFTGRAPGEAADPGGQTGNGSATGSGGPANGSVEDDGFLPGPIGRGLGYTTTVVGFMLDAVTSGLDALRDPERLYHTFVRSGWIPDLRYEVNDFETVELTMLESFPLFAALLWLPVAAVQRLRATEIMRFRGVLPTTAAGQTDLLAAGYAVVFTVVYLPRLPLISQITVRYILPVVPLILYGVVRFGVVNEAIARHWRALAGSYLVTLLVGGIALLTALFTLGLASGEAMQLHALLGIAAGAVGALAVLSEPLHERRDVVAIGLGVPAAAATLLVCFSGLVYFQYGPFALDVVRVATDWLPTV